MFRKHHVLMAAATGAALGSGATPLEKKAAATVGLPEGSVEILGVANWDTDAFKKEYQMAKTGVPMSEALDFGKFLLALVEGRHVGQKFLKKFSGATWTSDIRTEAHAGLSRVSLSLTTKGVKVCDALFGKNNGPLRMPKAKAPKGRMMFDLRSGAGDYPVIESDYVPIKSGNSHFEDKDSD